MPTIKIGDAQLHYQLEGPDHLPVLVLSNSLGTNLSMWGPQMPALYPHFRVLRYDTRGHGQSSVTPGPYSVAQLGQDVLALLDHLGIERAHFCGLSMGGQIGMWLASQAPQRIERLVLCNTGARIGTADSWNARIAKVNEDGLASIVPAVLDRWFTADFQQRAPQQVAIVREMLLNTESAGYAANCGAVRDADLREEIRKIVAPTLVIGGQQDQATPLDDSRLIADRIAGAELVELNAAHLSNWEVTQTFTAHLLRFLLGETAQGK